MSDYKEVKILVIKILSRQAKKSKPNYIYIKPL